MAKSCVSGEVTRKQYKYFFDNFSGFGYTLIKYQGITNYYLIDYLQNLALSSPQKFFILSQNFTKIHRVFTRNSTYRELRKTNNMPTQNDKLQAFHMQN